MPAVEAAPPGVVVVADADVWCESLREAVQAVEDGAPWAVPHRGVFRLTEAATEAFLEQGGDWESMPLEQRPYLGLLGGGFVVAHRDILLDIPLDPRFTGWGQEDASWGRALRCLLGPPWRGKVPLVHLWHPHPQRLDRRWGNLAGKRLWARYVAARNDPDRMRQLLNEAVSDEPGDPDGSHLRDHAAVG